MANRTSSRNNYNRSSNRNRRRRRRSRNRRRRMMPVLAGVLFIVLVLAVVLIAGVIRKYSLSDERADQMAYFGLEADDEVAVILQNEQAELHGLLIASACLKRRSNTSDNSPSSIKGTVSQNRETAPFQVLCTHTELQLKSLKKILIA